MALRSIVPSMGPTEEQRIIYKLAWDINGVWLKTPGSSPDFEAALQIHIEQQLEDHAAFLGDWEIAWGPSVVQFNTSLFPVNAMCVLHSRENPERYVVALNATNAISPFSWIVEDFLVGRQVPWATGNDPHARISLCTAIGLNILVERAIPSGKRPGAGSNLTNFFNGLDERNIDLTVTGISLGGTLSATLALFLNDTKHVWGAGKNVRISAMSICGATAGNDAFAAYSDRSLPTAVRFANTLDIVPHFWNIDTLNATKEIYRPALPPAPIINLLIDLARAHAAKGGDYLQLRNTVGIEGIFDHDAKLPITPGLPDPNKTPEGRFLAQAGYQHVGAYNQYFDLPGAGTDELARRVLDPKTILSPAVQYAMQKEDVDVPSIAGLAPAQTGPLTVPIDGQSVALPTSSDSPQMTQIVAAVSSSFQKTARAGK